MASPPLEFRRHQQQRERLLPAFGARDRLPRLGRRQRPERRLDEAPADRCASATRSRECGWRCRAAAPGRRARPPARRRSPSAPAAATAARRDSAMRLQHAAARPAQRRSRASAAISHSLGRLSLPRSRVPGLRRVDQRLRDLLQVAVGVEETLRQPLDQRRRRLVGDEVARELARDVRGGRRMAREIGEHRAGPARRRLSRIDLADDRLRARLVQARD